MLTLELKDPKVKANFDSIRAAAFYDVLIPLLCLIFAFFLALGVIYRTILSKLYALCMLRLLNVLVFACLVKTLKVRLGTRGPLLIFVPLVIDSLIVNFVVHRVMDFESTQVIMLLEYN